VSPNFPNFRPYLRRARLTEPAPLEDGDAVRLGDEKLAVRRYSGAPTDMSEGAL